MLKNYITDMMTKGIELAIANEGVMKDVEITPILKQAGYTHFTQDMHDGLPTIFARHNKKADGGACVIFNKDLTLKEISFFRTRPHGITVHLVITQEKRDDRFSYTGFDFLKDVVFRNELIAPLDEEDIANSPWFIYLNYIQSYTPEADFGNEDIIAHRMMADFITGARMPFVKAMIRRDVLQAKAV